MAHGTAQVKELLALLRALDSFGKLLVFFKLKLEKKPLADAWVGT